MYNVDSNLNLRCKNHKFNYDIKDVYDKNAIFIPIINNCDVLFSI